MHLQTSGCAGERLVNRNARLCILCLQGYPPCFAEWLLLPWIFWMHISDVCYITEERVKEIDTNTKNFGKNCHDKILLACIFWWVLNDCWSTVTLLTDLWKSPPPFQRSQAWNWPVYEKDPGPVTWAALQAEDISLAGCVGPTSHHFGQGEAMALIHQPLTLTHAKKPVHNDAIIYIGAIGLYVI